MSRHATTFTHEGLAKLVQAYQNGIIEYWDGDQRVKYDSLKQMKVAINDMRLELHNGYTVRPIGAVQYKTVKGYQR